MWQVLRSLGSMADLDIDELESLAQRVDMAKHQVPYHAFIITVHLSCILPLAACRLPLPKIQPANM